LLARPDLPLGEMRVPRHVAEAVIDLDHTAGRSFLPDGDNRAAGRRNDRRTSSGCGRSRS
jgi:hypothetical protein